MSFKSICASIRIRIIQTILNCKSFLPVRIEIYLLICLEKEVSKSNISHKHLKILLKYEDSDVRCSVAKNPNISPDLLKVALNDEKFVVCRCAAMNPKMTPELLDLALNHIDDGVQWQAYHNPNMTKEMKMIYRLSHTKPEWFWKIIPVMIKND